MNGAAGPRIYADHAATTSVRPEVADRMLEVMRSGGSNPSSLHSEGRRARAVLDDARERVARVLRAEPHEIVFTGGGSESDTLAIRGAALPIARERTGRRPHAVTPAFEHHAVLHAIEALAEDGFDVTILPVDAGGLVDRDTFRAALDPGRTVIASVMLANNEIGTVQPIAELVRIAGECGVLFHCDAVQAPGRIPIDVRTLGVDLLALSGHKFYGPKGVGMLFVRDGVTVVPQVHGGGQEAGRRSGTEDVAGIAGFALALELAESEREHEAARLAALRDVFELELQRTIGDVVFTARASPRLPNLSSFAIPGIEADVALASLDLAGAAVSSGSACAAGAVQTSHVLTAISVPAWVTRSTVRVSFGRLTGEQEVRRLAGMLSKIAQTRGVTPLFGHRPERF